MAMWSLLGATGVDILGWENFGFVLVSPVGDQMLVMTEVTPIHAIKRRISSR